MGKPKLNIAFCKSLAESNGGRCISTTYKNIETKLDWQCKLGHTWSATLDSVKNCKSWCPECAKSARATSKKKNNPPEIDKNNVDNYHKEYYKRNKEKILKANKEYRKQNKEKVNKINNTWRNKNKQKVTDTRTKTLNNNINSRIADRLRSRIKHAIKGGYKAGSAVRNLGCTVEELKNHLEAQFQPGMTWDNWTKYGWHIDHIKPLSSFNLTDPTEFKLACHYTNLQPMWAKENLNKSNNHIKTKVVLIAGPSGSGKTTLVKEIDSPLVMDGDVIKPDQLIYEALNKDIVFYFINIGISTFIKRFSNLYDIELYKVDISEKELENNLFQRGTELTPRLLSRKQYIDNLKDAKPLNMKSIKDMIIKMLGE